MRFHSFSINSKVWLLASISLASCSKNETKAPTIVPLAQCSADGQTQCLTTEAFPAAVKATLTTNAANYRSNITIGGVAGTVSNCSGDNGINCLTTAEFPSVVKAQITANSVVTGRVVAGVTGTYGPTCTTDGAVGCLTTTNFPAGKTDTITAYDVRVGKTFGGVLGKMIYNKNGAETANWNEFSVTGSFPSSGVVDPYDSVDDYNYTLDAVEMDGIPKPRGVPTSKPTGWPALSGNFKRDSASDTDADTTCNGIEACVLLDQNTGLYWAKSDATTHRWDDVTVAMVTTVGAITLCENSTYGTYTDWRLPTQKELMQLYIDAGFSKKTELGLSSANYHSATTLSGDGLSRYTVNLATGEVASGLKSSTTATYICVR